MSDDNRPSILFHGGSTPDIGVLEPRRIFIPGEADPERWPALVYASDLPGFAAAHAFPWDSEAGFQLSVDSRKRVKLRVPGVHRELLQSPVYIYAVPGDSFERTREEVTGHTFHSRRAVPVMSCTRFASAEEAITHHGGVVTYF